VSPTVADTLKGFAMRRRAIILGLSLLTAACAGFVRDPGPARALSPDAERGERFAQRACAGCHAIRPSDQGTPRSAPAFATLRLRYNRIQTERRLATISERGHYEMPPIFISADEAKDLAAYIESLGDR
jgi:mono/diheme cytochrome c family protein